MQINQHVNIEDNEFSFTFTTSPGPGGQNVNKVATCATLKFNVRESGSLTVFQKNRIAAALANRIDRNGILRITSSRYRSQSANKQDAIERLAALLCAALKPRAVRRPTKPTKGSRERRLEAKRQNSSRKSARRPPPRHDD
ncbi:MAG: aminoacyl-tRNA hydrolase [Planctomycetes bacterium]|nr:aminoacyl-tRNA hydrolase [Planctomycetota bacterium]